MFHLPSIQESQIQGFQELSFRVLRTGLAWREPRMSKSAIRGSRPPLVVRLRDPPRCSDGAVDRISSRADRSLSRRDRGLRAGRSFGRRATSGSRPAAIRADCVRDTPPPRELTARSPPLPLPATRSRCSASLRRLFAQSSCCCRSRRERELSVAERRTRSGRAGDACICGSTKP